MICSYDHWNIDVKAFRRKCNIKAKENRERPKKVKRVYPQKTSPISCIKPTYDSTAPTYILPNTQNQELDTNSVCLSVCFLFFCFFSSQFLEKRNLRSIKFSCMK
ncbi:hypothetical protein TWF730_006615 [Orbilia blumenaviensis]|uniref:Uncharacterized protein n=1 Tax=Orbilia blumenaviensis TaxID=1796055 RepID=A0AAV9VFA9_9PEZI